MGSEGGATGQQAQQQETVSDPIVKDLTFDSPAEVRLVYNRPENDGDELGIRRRLREEEQSCEMRQRNQTHHARKVDAINTLALQVESLQNKIEILVESAELQSKRYRKKIDRQEVEIAQMKGAISALTSILGGMIPQKRSLDEGVHGSGG